MLVTVIVAPCALGFVSVTSPRRSVARFDSEEGLEWNDLEWRVQRARLVHYDTQRILRRKPRYLCYDEASKWVQRMGLWRNKKEWKQWLASGEKRNPYIPNDPEKYYGDKFRGWADFLHGEDWPPKTNK
ncbi:hypothetical protein CTAYLR_006699 [Chrysophaeum taylorii]|uniref:Uncharacterized protein n=1 Tax=Chrysophaeum taylorii TaxID=2483200 RepID=A0AAD7XKH8_9STRA|nr:hypothetical protein CTAYLR_006699 [Chrysophaeum taylorii]